LEQQQLAVVLIPLTGLRRVHMWQAIAVTSDADLLEVLREQIETPGYAVVEAGSASDAINLLETSGPCLVILLAHLMRRPRSKAQQIPALSDTSSKRLPAYLLLAANPVTMLAMQGPMPPPSVITVIEPTSLEELLVLMSRAEQYLGSNPALLAAPLHPSLGNFLGASW
jgi:CheY-like chemotaxis protein